jgi:hypothetical protein
MEVAEEKKSGVKVQILKLKSEASLPKQAAREMKHGPLSRAYPSNALVHKFSTGLDVSWHRK